MRSSLLSVRERLIPTIKAIYRFLRTLKAAHRSFQLMWLTVSSGLLPNIIESLSGKFVKFMPMSAMDEAQADLETDITHFTFSEDNNGYLALYEAAKDALLTGVGIFKIWYDDAPERVVESYAGIDENQLQALLGDPMVEVTEIERSEVEGIRATAARIIRQGRVRVQALPAEEFRVASDLHSLDLKEARFCAHTCRKTVSDLLSEGYDPDQVENAADGYLHHEIGDYNSPDTSDDSQRLIVITEAIFTLISTKMALLNCARSPIRVRTRWTKSLILRRWPRCRLWRCRRSQSAQVCRYVYLRSAQAGSRH